MPRHAISTSFKKGHIPWNKGRRLPEKIKARMRGPSPGFVNQTSFKPRQHFSPNTEFKKGQSQWWVERGIPCPNKELEARQKISARVKQRFATDPSCRKKISEAAKRQMANPRMRAYLSRMAKQRVKDPEYMRKILSSRRPTDIEQAIIDIIERYGLPYRYTGNGTFQLGGKYPDFVNTNGQKVAVDIFGDHWHSPGEIPERQAIFAEYGWKLIVIWGHEIKDLSESELVNKIEEE